jgi:transposase
MARPFSHFIKKLTKSQIKKLNDLKDAGITSRERHRAHAILLSHQGRNVVEIASIFEVHRKTILEWLHRWDESGLESLADQPRPGTPPKLTQPISCFVAG